MNWRKQLGTVAIIAFNTYVLSEIAAYFFLCTNFEPVTKRILNLREQHAFVTPDITEFDPVAGYRWRRGLNRYAYVINGHVVYDQRFSGNAQGYAAPYDFLERKQPGVFRIVVLGDSFTAGEFLGLPWPYRVNELLKEKSKRKFEVYSFAVDGGGIVNWHELFFKEIVPHYEFDAVVFAVFGDDLSRPFSIYQTSDEGWYFSRVVDPPKSVQEFLVKVRPNMSRLGEVKTDEQISALVEPLKHWHWAKPGLYLAQMVANRMRTKSRDEKSRGSRPLSRPPLEPETPEPKTYDPAWSLRHDYKVPLAYRVKLAEMLKYCQKHQIPAIVSVIPSVIPDPGGFLRTPKEKWIPYEGQWYESRLQVAMAAYAERYGAEYHDGYRAFDGLSMNQIRDEYWLHFDPHWNTKGSDHYARNLAEFILKSWDRS